jgi:hypothetical protein
MLLTQGLETGRLAPLTPAATGPPAYSVMRQNSYCNRARACWSKRSYATDLRRSLMLQARISQPTLEKLSCKNHARPMV